MARNRLATVAGLSLRPDQAEAIVAAGMALAGLLGVFLSDEPKSVKIELPPITLQGRPESGNAGADPQPVRPADELRQSVPPNYQPSPTGTADQNTYPRFSPTGTSDPNTYPRFGTSGFGDRD